MKNFIVLKLEKFPVRCENKVMSATAEILLCRGISCEIYMASSWRRIILYER